MINESLTPAATCFVICPFGNERTSAEEARIFTEINDLHQNVFRDVETICAEQGFPVRILDARELNNVDQDTIRDKVIELIDRADVVLTIMTADKPNGFIEYGWAMGMWKKPIILCSAEYKLPTNINNALAIEYDPDHIDGSKPERVRKLIDQLAARMLRDLRTPGRKVPFEHLPKTMLAHGAINVLGRFKDISIKDWSDTLLAAESEIIVASNAMWQITTQPFQDADGTKTSIESLLLKKAMQRVKVTVLMQHPDNTTTAHLRNTSLKSGLDRIRNTQLCAFDTWATVRRIFEQKRRSSDLDLSEDGFRVIQLRNRFLPFRATLTDKKLYMTLRLYTQGFNSGLCLVAEPGAERDDENPSVYDQIRDELEFLIDENAVASEEGYQRWLRTAAE
jgi:hypothetical protein